ncbi:MAG: hypothetical protein ACRDY7_15655 [Acidimicrobiia bacterium]
MYQLTQADVLGLQALPEADSVVTDEVAGMRRSRRGGGDRRTNVCLITLSNVLNRVDILNIFGGGLGL